MMISAGNAASRYLFSERNNAWLEIQWYMFSGMFLLGAAYTLKHNEHVRVDLVYSSVSDRARLWIDIFGLVFFLLPAMTILAYMGWPFFYDAFERGEISGNAGGLLRWPGLPIVIALATTYVVATLSPALIAARPGAVRTCVVASEPLVLAVRPDDPLARRATIAFGRLRAHPFVTLARGTGLRAGEVRGILSLNALMRASVEAEEFVLVRPELRLVMQPGGRPLLPATGAAAAATDLVSFARVASENGARRSSRRVEPR